MPHGHIHSCLKSSTSSRTRDTGPQALPALTSTAFRPSGRILLRFHIPSSCRPRVAIIGSREQLCIHPEVSKKESNSEKVGDGTPTEKKNKKTVPFFIPKLFPKLTVHPPNLGHGLVLTSLPWLPAVMATSWWLNHSFIQVHLCRAKVQSHSCGYYANVNGTAQSCYSISAQVIFWHQRVVQLFLSCSACSEAAEDHWECDGHRRLGPCW